MSTREAAFIGVGSMVGAGIFSLLGTAGEVAGNAVWVSFVLAGVIAALQGYSFARLGARYPSAGGLLEYVNRGYGDGHIATALAWLVFWTNAIVTAMVASSFGSYAASAFGITDAAAVKAFAALIVVVMTALNIAGSTFVAKVQSVIVFVVVGILALFSVVTLLNINPELLSPSIWPPAQDIFSSVALTFFAFLGFGIVTFTARDLREPSKQLPQAMTIAIGIAAVVYIAVSLGVFGTLTVPQVIAAGPTAIAEAAKPVLGALGFWLMTVTALFATSGATNAGLYPAIGLTDHLVSTGQFPPIMARRYASGRVQMGLLLSAVAILVLVLGKDLSAIASIGSAVALLVFCMVTIGHLRIRADTNGNLVILLLALATAGIALVTFVVTTLIKEPASVVTIVLIVALSVALDFGWAWYRDRQAPAAA